MQGLFKARLFIYNKQVEDLQTEQNKGLWKSWDTLLNNYIWGGCSYENEKHKISLHSRRETEKAMNDHK